MKKLSLTILFFLVIVISHAQWQGDIRLTNDTNFSSTSFNNARSLGVSGNMLHVIWSDDRDGNREIYYKQSADQGLSWGNDIRLTADSSTSIFPSICVSGLQVHVVWEEYRDGNSEIYYKNSMDGGMTWSSDMRLTFNSSNSFSPSVAVSDSVVHVAWFDQRDGNNEIYYKRSPDAGATWATDARITNDNAASVFPSVSVSGQQVHIAWEEYRDGNGEIYYKRSPDAGISWGSDTRLTFNISNSFSPCVFADGLLMNIVWHDERDGNQEIYSKRSPDGGISWGSDARLTNDSSVSNYPAVCISGSNVHVTWFDERDGNAEIYYKRSIDGGLTWANDTRLTFDAARSTDPAIAVSNTIVHILWTDARDNFPVYTGNYEIYYKRDSTANVTSIETAVMNETAEPVIYPNPAYDFIQVSKRDEKDNSEIEILNAFGEIILVTKNQRIDISRIQNGIYIVKMHFVDRIKISKFIKI